MDYSLSLDRNNIRNIVALYGWPILSSPLFLEAFHHSHHKHTTVAEHSINVAIISAMICIVLRRIGIMVNIRNSIEASLGHDLGMIGRDKYKNERETCRMHPIDSARLMRVICPEAGKNVYRAIETHMWPLYSSSPESLEGYILTIADKISAISEFLRADWHCRHIVMMPAYY